MSWFQTNNEPLTPPPDITDSEKELLYNNHYQFLYIHNYPCNKYYVHLLFLKKNENLVDIESAKIELQKTLKILITSCVK